MTPDERSKTALIIRRTIAAPRERVFDAWLDPMQLARFMHPGDVSQATAEVDARVGGHFRIVMEHGRGNAEHWGKYVVIDRPSTLVFTWLSGGTDGRSTTVTIDFTERSDGGTDLVLTHRDLPSRTSEAHEHGWGAIVDKLGTIFQA